MFPLFCSSLCFLSIWKTETNDPFLECYYSKFCWWWCKWRIFDPCALNIDLPLCFPRQGTPHYLFWKGNCQGTIFWWHYLCQPCFMFYFQSTSTFYYKIWNGLFQTSFQVLLYFTRHPCHRICYRQSSISRCRMEVRLWELKSATSFLRCWSTPSNLGWMLHSNYI